MRDTGSHSSLYLVTFHFYPITIISVPQGANANIEVNISGHLLVFNSNGVVLDTSHLCCMFR